MSAALTEIGASRAFRLLIITISCAARRARRCHSPRLMGEQKQLDLADDDISTCVDTGGATLMANI